MNPPLIRRATPADLPRCLAIYTPYVLESLATFEEVPPGADAFAERFQAIGATGLPYLVAERDGRVLGYAYAAAYRARAAYRHTVENSIYVDRAAHRQGTGRALLEALLDECTRGPWRQMVAVIGDSANAASIALHARCGFRTAGTLESVGFKFGRWVDTVLMQRPLGAGDTQAPA
ncbi:N-acetyltransferase [Nitrogeniibacter mangrovi]|uniref:N-acetyltransferase n=1 Tax=Nitrogeniibacter mangrovi TaxID=2016596 RepID=A0A6C1B6J1_9RHOO|nr:GNAT family N-acetyltransferase [Nitrogeniibacter mangrovi]QID19356.1 N-acetyltransferase [Nitrogeniibacter mangrovi]